MMKLLIWLVIAFAAFTWVKRTLLRLTASDRTRPDGRHEQNVETMLQCAHCGVHFPASEAVTGSTGAVFCCAEHRAQSGSA